jgi:hypothetical protein
MVDELRKKASNENFFGEFETDSEFEHKSKPKTNPGLFLGMTPVQRLVIAVMILLMTCVMGSFLLFVTEKVYFPFV